jgi:hypothetical protein
MGPALSPSRQGIEEKRFATRLKAPLRPFGAPPPLAGEDEEGKEGGIGRRLCGALEALHFDGLCAFAGLGNVVAVLHAH